MKTINKSIIGLVILIFLAPYGCSESKIEQLSIELNGIKKEVTKLDELSLEIKELKMRVLELEKNTIENRIDISDLTSQHKSILLDQTSKSYQKLETNTGTFFISLQDIKPYGGGFKLKLVIGNPYSAQFNGFKLFIVWGKEFKGFKNYAEWKELLREKEISFTDTIYPATWNKIELVISPAKNEDIGYLKLSMITDLISLITRKAP